MMMIHLWSRPGLPEEIVGGVMVVFPPPREADDDPSFSRLLGWGVGRHATGKQDWGFSPRIGKDPVAFLLPR